MALQAGALFEERPSLARLSAPLVSRLVNDADSLRIGVRQDETGALLVDAGIDKPGGLEAGLRIAEICLGGLGRVSLQSGGSFPRWPWSLNVHTSNPVLACLGSQYAGWSLSHKDGDESFHALGSGPGRALAGKEELFAEIDYSDNGDSAVLVLEVDKAPPKPLIEKIANDCGVTPGHLKIILTPTQSLAGAVQIVARVLEVALHKAHVLGFPLTDIVDGAGSTPLPPPSPSFIDAMGRTNDAILFGGHVHLFVKGGDSGARDLAEQLPSSNSRDFGKLFAEIFTHYKNDFFAIDPMLFAPAQVIVTALESGRSFHAGELNSALIDRSFGYG